MQIGETKISLPRIESLTDFLRLIALLASPYIFWLYSNKFLGMSADYITSMSRDITVLGIQRNLSFYPMDKLMLFYGGLILLCFLLIQNEFKDILRSIRSILLPASDSSGQFQWSKISTSIFGILSFILCYIILIYSPLEFSAGTQVPFFFLGGALVAGIILLQDNINDIPHLFSKESFQRLREGSPKEISSAISISTILIFAVITVNMPMFPFVSNDIPAFLSAMTLLVAISWTFLLSREGSRPTVQSKRTAALAFFVIFPFVSYLFLRLIFLMNDGTNPTMLNRWEVRFDFMEKVNTFKINPWPMEAEPNQDSRWVFLKAGIINSARVTLVSIFLCTVLGIIVGVTRLSTNRLASTAATVYVEVFRNLPLAVLLFLISSQMGAQLPYFIDEYSIIELSENDTGSEAVAYISNEGTWVLNFGSYAYASIGLALILLTRVWLRFQDRVQPRSITEPTGIGHIRRPISQLGWRNEALVADLFLVFALFLCALLLGPFISTEKGGDAQTLNQIASSFLPALLGILTVIFAFFVTTNIDDDGMNNLEIDDSTDGVRKRFTIWTGAMAVALGIALVGGISWPEYTQDWNYDGVIDSPGSWDIVEGTGFEMTPAFLAMMLGLTLFTTSVVAEIVRGSIQSLPRGQVEAAISLSLNPYQRLRLVILPQALRSMVPLLNNQYMNVWKNSSLAVVVAYTDIFYVILVMMNNVGKLVPLFLLLLITYQAGSLTISAIMNWYNSRVTSVKI